MQNKSGFLKSLLCPPCSRTAVHSGRSCFRSPRKHKGVAGRGRMDTGAAAALGLGEARGFSVVIHPLPLGCHFFRPFLPKAVESANRPIRAPSYSKHFTFSISFISPVSYQRVPMSPFY